MEEACGQVDILGVQGNKLRHPDSGGVQQLQHGLVPAALGVPDVGLLQKQVYLPVGEDGGQPALNAVGGEALGRVEAHKMGGGHVGIEGLQRRHGTHHRGVGLPRLLQVAGVPLHILLGGLEQLQPVFVRPVGELAHIPDIGAEGVGGGPLLPGQPRLITGDVVQRAQLLSHRFNSLAHTAENRAGITVC